jgi:hypothetical protein
MGGELWALGLEFGVETSSAEMRAKSGTLYSVEDEAKQQIFAVVKTSFDLIHHQ